MTNINDTLPEETQGGEAMPVIVCPHCSRGSDFRLSAQAPKVKDSKIVCAIGVCRLCEREVWFELLKDNLQQVNSHWPLVRENAPKELPEGVQRAFDEALRCFGAQAWNGALCMCRRAIQDALIDLGAPPKANLPTQLEALVESRKITPALKEWADQARIGGKLAAHGTGGDEWGEPEQEWAEQSDADAVIDFCRSFFEYAYVMKERLRERQKRLLASQSGTDSSEE